jgi:hypothetical protein
VRTLLSSHGDSDRSMIVRYNQLSSGATRSFMQRNAVRRNPLVVWLIAAVMLLSAPIARAQLSIEITGAGATRIPIAIVPFAGEAALPPGLSSIVRADLERSGPTAATRYAFASTTW